MNIKRNLSIVVCATLILSFVSTAISKPVQAKSTRVAVISDLTGSATVKSSGGSRQYDAYIDMGLNQGDYITTDDDSSVVLKIKDHSDEVTIGSNSVVSLVSLADKGKGKKSKLKVISGSLWSNVSKLSGGDDFEIETPTAVMAVRGTKVLTSVNSESGETYVAVAAGTVSAKTSTNDNNNNNNNNGNTGSNGGGSTVLIAASQQLSLDSRDEVNDLETKVAIIDPDKLVATSSSNIIEAIVKDKKDIDRENAEFVAAQKDKIDKGDNTDISRGDANSSLTTKDLSALDKVTKNLDNLIGNVVKSAIDSNKVDKDKINKIIDDVNKTLDDSAKKIDLTKVVPLDKNAGVDEALKKAKDAELAKLAEQKKLDDAAKKQKEDDTKQKLAESLKKLEEEKARIAREKEVLGIADAAARAAAKAAADAATAKAAAEAAAKAAAEAAAKAALDRNNSSSPSTTPKPELITPVILLDNTQVPNGKLFQDNTEFTLAIGIRNLTVSDQVYGVEVHVVFKKYNIITKASPPTSPPTPTPTSDLFDTNSETRYALITDLTATNEILYVAVIPGTRAGGITGDKNLVRLPLHFSDSIFSSNDIIVYVKVVDKNGNPIIDSVSTGTTTSAKINPTTINFTAVTHT